jgi:hypothetical protein
MGVIEACFSLVFIVYGWSVKCVKTLERLGIFGFRWLQYSKQIIYVKAKGGLWKGMSKFEPGIL